MGERKFVKTEDIMGYPVDNLTYEKIVMDLPEYLNSEKKMTAISVNPQIIVEGEKHPLVLELIKKSTHRIPDGIGIVLVSKMTKGSIKERVAGIELMKAFLRYADEHGKSIFLFGAKPEILKDAAASIQREYRNLILKGTIDGYTSLSEKEVVDQINQTKPDFLFVALGFPRQEEWLERNVPFLNASVFQDVGGSFDVLSGHVKRAPQFFIDVHLEWLYRSLSDPKRIGRIFQLPVFLVKSLWWKVRNNDKTHNK